MDISQPDDARKIFSEMLTELGRVDFIYLNAGTGYQNPDLHWDLEEETIRVNVLGFAALATAAWEFFLKQGHGHLIGITSVAAMRGSRIAPAYGASKAFDANLLEALRLRAWKAKLPIHVTEIRPGFVDTAMAKSPQRFWVAPTPVAVRQIIRAVENKKSVAYVTRRWRLIACLMKLMPARLFAKLT
jgi:short-subunit dehydrogenase